jgi:hypothetical protein
MEHLCKNCNKDISNRKASARICVECDKERERDRKRKMQKYYADKNPSGFRPVGQSSITPDTDRLAASRVKGGGSRKAALSKTANGIAHRARTQSEIKSQIEREYALRKEAALLPDKLRAEGITVHVRVSSEALKHLDKQDRRTYERGTKAGFQVLPEPRHYSLAGQDRLINYIGFVVR